jgi:hypothetical protein
VCLFCALVLNDGTDDKGRDRNSTSNSNTTPTSNSGLQDPSSIGKGTLVFRGERYSSWKHTRGSAYERAGIDTGSHLTPHKREPDTNDWMFREKRRIIRGPMKVRRVERTGKDPRFSETDADSSLRCLLKPSRTDTVPTKNKMFSNRDTMIKSITEEAEGVNC